MGLPPSNLELYSVAHQRRLPLHPSNIVLPMPLHLPIPTAFTPIDAHRYLPTASGGTVPYPPHPTLLDSLHFGNGVFTRPFPTSKLSDSIFQQPMLPSMRPGTLHKAGGVECTAANDDEVTSSEETKLLNMPNYSPNFTYSYVLDREAISESAAKLLFLAVKWAKSVPSFNHISVRDQNLLIEESWAELFVITSAQYGLPIESKQATQE